MAITTELSPEDELRLNVLMANAVHAVRIDEAANVLYALTAQGEAKLRLHPNCKPDRYFKRLREALSSHVLGSPGGYPIYLRRWTRMGDITSTKLEGLLLLGEPEAVVAVVRSPRLTEELAAHAWWAMPNAENARHMLERPEVAQSKLAKELAEFLVEFLPFEEDPADMIDSVRLVLQPGLINQTTRDKLWKMGARKTAIRVGFMAAHCQDRSLNFPEQKPQHALATVEPQEQQYLHNACQDGQHLAQLIAALCDPRGQAFVETAQLVLKKPATQEVVSKLLNVLGHYFASSTEAPDSHGDRNTAARTQQSIQQRVEQQRQQSDTQQLLAALPGFQEQLEACLYLSHISDAIVTPIFATSSAVGSVMRKQIAPVSEPILARLRCLQRS